MYMYDVDLIGSKCIKWIYGLAMSSVTPGKITPSSIRPRMWRVAPPIALHGDPHPSAVPSRAQAPSREDARASERRATASSRWTMAPSCFSMSKTVLEASLQLATFWSLTWQTVSWNQETKRPLIRYGPLWWAAIMAVLLTCLKPSGIEFGCIRLHRL